MSKHQGREAIDYQAQTKVGPRHREFRNFCNTSSGHATPNKKQKEPRAHSQCRIPLTKGSVSIPRVGYLTHATKITKALREYGTRWSTRATRHSRKSKGSTGPIHERGLRPPTARVTSNEGNTGRERKAAMHAAHATNSSKAPTSVTSKREQLAGRQTKTVQVNVCP